MGKQKKQITKINKDKPVHRIYDKTENAYRDFDTEEEAKKYAQSLLIQGKTVTHRPPYENECNATITEWWAKDE